MGDKANNRYRSSATTKTNDKEKCKEENLEILLQWSESYTTAVSWTVCDWGHSKAELRMVEGSTVMKV